MLPDPLPGTRLYEIADGAGFDFQQRNRVPERARPIIRRAFDVSIAVACLTLLALAVCSPL